MPFWRLYFHLVWSTKEREPLLVGEVPTVVERSIRATCNSLRIRIFAIGMMPDHVHLVVSIPPSLAVAEAVRRLKGASSYAANHPDLGSRPTRFSWQSEYGALSVGEKALPDVIAYACNQPTRHRPESEWPALERTTDAP